MGRTLSPKHVNNLLDTKPQPLEFEKTIPKESYLSPGSKKQVEKFSKTDTDGTSNLAKNLAMNRVNKPAPP